MSRRAQPVEQRPAASSVWGRNIGSSPSQVSWGGNRHEVCLSADSIAREQSQQHETHQLAWAH
eukprot:3324755-Rhodomonas_salina.1